MLIHCTMDELLAIRSGEGSPGAMEHLESCDLCTEEMERLHQRVAALKALPAIPAPRERWSMVREEVIAGRRSTRRRLATWMSLATAASVAAAIGLTRLPILQTVDTQAYGDPRDEFVVLLDNSQSLEQALRQLRPETRVLNGRQATAVAVIEDRISLIDAQLGEARIRRLPRTDLILLLQERVDLMDALLDIHTVNSTLIGF